MAPKSAYFQKSAIWGALLSGILFLSSLSGNAEEDALFSDAPPIRYPHTLEGLCREGLLCLRENEPALVRLGLQISDIIQAPFAMRTSEYTGELSPERRTQFLTLRLRKLLKFCRLGEWGQLGEQDLRPGRFDEQTLFVGEKVTELESLERFAKSHPEVERLIHALYLGGSTCTGFDPQQDKSRPAHFWMIPESRYQEVEQLAQVKLDQFLATQDPRRPRALAAQASNFRPGVTLVNSVDNAWNSWEVQVLVDPAGIHLGQNLSASLRTGVPPSVVALHELEHVRRIGVGQSEEEQEGSSLEELGPVIEQIVLQDELLKKAESAPITSVKRYACRPPGAPDKPSPELGELANFFRTQIQRTGSPERAVMSEEGLRWLRQYF